MPKGAFVRVNVVAPAAAFDLSKEVMTSKTQFLAVVIRLDYVEKKMMMKQPLEQVIYEEAQKLAHQRNWSVSFTLSIMWSRFKGAGELKEAEAAFILMQREEEHKDKGDPIFTEW